MNRVRLMPDPVKRDNFNIDKRNLICFRSNGKRLEVRRISLRVHLRILFSPPMNVPAITEYAGPRKSRRIG